MYDFILQKNKNDVYLLKFNLDTSFDLFVYQYNIFFHVNQLIDLVSFLSVSIVRIFLNQLY